MKTRYGFCPCCGAEIAMLSKEAVTQNPIFAACHTERCQLAKEEIKTDPNGFVMEPPEYRGYYIWSHPPYAARRTRQ